jgi:hypothetical protein
LANYFLKDAQFFSGGKISLRLFREIFVRDKTKQFPEKQAFKKRFAKIIIFKNHIVAMISLALIIT